MYRRRLTLCALLFLTALPHRACTQASTDDAMRVVRIFDLQSAYKHASTELDGKAYVSDHEFRVNGEIRPGIFLNAPGAITFPPVRVSAASVLSFKIGVREEVWGQTGDGVEFIVFVQRLNDARTKIFARYVDPKHVVADRRWIEQRIPLHQFGEEQVRIIFVTAPGPARDPAFDWAVWAEPEVVLDVRAAGE